MKAVHFYEIETNNFQGQGYCMPDFETFEDYALRHMKATKISDNKYKLRDSDSYICLENIEFRQNPLNE